MHVFMPRHFQRGANREQEQREQQQKKKEREGLEGGEQRDLVLPQQSLDSLV